MSERCPPGFRRKVLDLAVSGRPANRTGRPTPTTPSWLPRDADRRTRDRGPPKDAELPHPQDVTRQSR